MHLPSNIYRWEAQIFWNICHHSMAFSFFPPKNVSYFSERWSDRFKIFREKFFIWGNILSPILTGQIDIAESANFEKVTQSRLVIVITFCWIETVSIRCTIFDWLLVSWRQLDQGWKMPYRLIASDPVVPWDPAESYLSEILNCQWGGCGYSK